VQHLQERRLQCGGSRLPMGLAVALHDPREHAVPGQLAGGGQPRRPGADHEDPIARVDHATIESRTRNT
jgi:hypothetical protein